MVKKNNQKSASSKGKRKKFTYAVGRRKEATAQVRLYQGKGVNLINELPVESYFPGKVSQTVFEKPFQVNGTWGNFFVTALVKGSGKRAQLEAVVHGMARALDQVDPGSFHEPLKKNDLLTRDARAKERRKAGQMGRARKKKQSPKR